MFYTIHIVQGATIIRLINSGVPPKERIIINSGIPIIDVKLFLSC